METLLHPESFYQPHYGTIQNCKNNEWADVGWESVNNSYPIGAEGMYALSIRKGIYHTTQFDGAVCIIVLESHLHLNTNHFTLVSFILDPLTLGEKVRFGVGGMMVVGMLGIAMG